MNIEVWQIEVLKSISLKYFVVISNLFGSAVLSGMSAFSNLCKIYQTEKQVTCISRLMNQCVMKYKLR